MAKRRFALGLALAGTLIGGLTPSTASATPTVASSVNKKLVTLTAGDGSSGDQFGDAVAIAGTTAVVGAWKHDSTAGAAYIFTKTTAGWVQQAELLASDGATGDYFGDAVAVAGNIAVIGAFQKDGRGAAYVFVRAGTTWSQQAELSAGDGSDGDGFGVSVAVSGTTVVVGANGHNNDTGAAYVFTRSGTSWPQRAELTAPDGADNDTFGLPVSISDSTIGVGAQGHDDYTGAAYMFLRTDSRWSLQAELRAPDGAASNYFGESLSVQGNLVAVGAEGKNSFTGSAYVFARTGTTWSEEAELAAPDGADNDYFGYSVSLSKTTVLISNGPAGLVSAAYVFAQSGTAWIQQEELSPPSSDPSGGFSPAALSGVHAIIGSDDDLSSAGAALIS